MNSFSLLSVAVVCLLAVCECVPTSYPSSDFGGYSGGSSSYGGGSSSYGGISNSGYGHEEEEHHEPKPYAFGYAVKDFKKGTNFNQHETSDGHTIKGQYAVALPDGRMQIVTYNADWKNGYHADVKYVGEAHHPEIYATNYGAHDSGSYGSGHEYEGGHASSSNFQSLGAAGGGSSSHGSYGGGFTGY